MLDFDHTIAFQRCYSNAPGCKWPADIVMSGFWGKFLPVQGGGEKIKTAPLPIEPAKPGR
jgi:hypothetical protein